MRKMPGAKILLYNIDPARERGRKLLAVLRGAGAACLTAGRDAGAQTLGSLFGAEGFAPCAPGAEGADREALVFYRLSEQELNRVLAALKRAGISVPLKAVVTEHNIGWTVDHLLEELEREHRLMQAWQRLSGLARQYRGTDRALLARAKELLASHAPDEEELNAVAARLAAQQPENL